MTQRLLRGVIMNEELDYAEMLEIPVETVTVNRKERRKREREPDLREQLVQEVNERMETERDPSYAESTPIARENNYESRRNKTSRRILICEFVAVCALCAAIFLTNIFVENSAINTFVRGLFRGSAAAQMDTRVYSDFSLSPIVNDSVEVDIAVSDTGVLSFVQRCSVYPPCEGTLASVNGTAETGYTVEIRHSDSFFTIMSGLDAVYSAEGEKLKANLPIGYSDGEGEVRVMFYSNGSLLNCLTVNENNLAWS